jgi:hypothetical protein
VNITSNEDLRIELLNIYKDLGSLNEVDWSKVRNLIFTEHRDAERVAIGKMASAHCLECPDFLEHVSSQFIWAN